MSIKDLETRLAALEAKRDAPVCLLQLLARIRAEHGITEPLPERLPAASALAALADLLPD